MKSNQKEEDQKTYSGCRAWRMTRGFWSDRPRGVRRTSVISSDPSCWRCRSASRRPSTFWPCQCRSCWSGCTGRRVHDHRGTTWRWRPDCHRGSNIELWPLYPQTRWGCHRRRSGSIQLQVEEDSEELKNSNKKQITPKNYLIKEFVTKCKQYNDKIPTSSFPLAHIFIW